MMYQTANVLVALDKGNLVPKYGVTAPEIAVLRAIHGTDAVTDIEPAGEVDRSPNEELARLRDLYKAAHDEDNRPVIHSVYPVPGALHSKLADLELDDSLFRAKTRVKASDKPTDGAKRRAEAGSDALEIPQGHEGRQPAHADAFD